MERTERFRGRGTGRFRFSKRQAGGLALGSLCFLAGAGFWGLIDRGLTERSDRQQISRQQLRNEALASMLGQGRLHASAASRTDSFAVATGPIDEEVEGLFILDFVSGNLQCVVLNYRSGKFTGIFRANVMKDLGMDAAAKRPSYLLVAGTVNFPRGASVARPGRSVAYVLDTTTGSYGAYAIPWRREMAATARPQTGGMILLDVGRARTAAIRE